LAVASLLMPDDQWAIFEPFLSAPGLRGGRPPGNLAVTLNFGPLVPMNSGPPLGGPVNIIFPSFR
jgi:hypothetical protein